MVNQQIYLNDEKWNECVSSLKTIANNILNGHIALIEGSVEIVALLHRLPMSIDNNSEFTIFHALSSETTHLPLAHVRGKWNEISLIKVDKEIKEIEKRFNDDIRQACYNLLNFNFENVRFK